MVINIFVRDCPDSRGGKMKFKEFWKLYSYRAVKIFVAQLAISLFGQMLAFATGNNEKLSWLQLASSVLAVGLFLFIIYGDIWKTGSEDKIRVEGGRMTRRPATGFLIALLANIPNILNAVIITISIEFAKGGILSTIGAGAAWLQLFLQGSWTGILALKLGDAPLNSYWWVHFAILLPSFVVCGIAYIMGLGEKHLTNVFMPQTPEEIEIERMRKKGKDKDGNDL